MAKISINLLPPEIIAKGVKQASFYKIQIAGVAVILAMVFLASLTVALRILQSRNIAVIQKKITQSEERITALKGTQAALLLLKNRLEIVSKYLGVPSEQASMYKLINEIVPQTVAISSMAVTKTGEVSLLAVVPDNVVLDDLVHKLTLKENNEGKISQVGIESLNRGRDGLYRISLKIKR